MPHTLVTFHAHPDDEAIATAGVMAKAAAEGHRVVLVVATRGEHAGFGRGFGLPGPAALSTKHTLALTNRGDACAADLVRLAREIRDGVRAAFGITLEPEPVLVGVTL